MNKQDKKNNKAIKQAKEYLNKQFNAEFDNAKRMVIHDTITYGFITQETQEAIDKLRNKS